MGYRTILKEGQYIMVRASAKPSILVWYGDDTPEEVKRNIHMILDKLSNESKYKDKIEFCVVNIDGDKDLQEVFCAMNPSRKLPTATSYFPYGASCSRVFNPTEEDLQKMAEELLSLR